MRFRGDSSQGSTTVVDDAPSSVDSPFGSRRQASELESLIDDVQPYLIGAPRGAVPPAADVATKRVTPRRPRSRRSRDMAPAPVETKIAVEAIARPARVREPERYRFTGTMSVSVGPFDDLARIDEFAELVGAVPGVTSVLIRTFDRQTVVFEVVLSKPTRLIAAIREWSYRPLRLLHANERIIRLKLV